MNNISLFSIKNLTISLLHRYHIVLFVIVILGGLGVTIFLLNGIILQSSESGGYTSASNNATFDQTTINRIKQLKSTTDTQSLIDTTKGRTNPFVE